MSTPAFPNFRAEAQQLRRRCRRRPYWHVHCRRPRRSWPLAGAVSSPITGNHPTRRHHLRASFRLDSGHLRHLFSSPPPPSSYLSWASPPSAVAPAGNSFRRIAGVGGCARAQSGGLAGMVADQPDPIIQTDTGHLVRLVLGLFGLRFRPLLNGLRYISWSLIILDMYITCCIFCDMSILFWLADNLILFFYYWINFSVYWLNWPINIIFKFWKFLQVSNDRLSI